jgi:hypothetical protein
MSNKLFLYKVLAFFMFALVIIGFNPVTIGLFVVSLFTVLSLQTFVDSLKNVTAFLLFVFSSLIVGIYFALCNGIQSWNIPYWGQFYFLILTILAIEDKETALKYLGYCVIAVFIADIGTNILLLAGFNVPWSELPPVRPGESMSRFTGVKGNTLYSGSITFMAFCIFLKLKNARWWYIAMLAILFNLVLSGSYRYFIICAVVFVLYFLKLYKKTTLLHLTYIGCIIVVFISTLVTMFYSLSNFMRFNIWLIFFDKIADSPILGHGFFNMHLDNLEGFTVQRLADNGVTESCIILLAYNFGLIVLSFFLMEIYSALNKYKNYDQYMPELGLFMGLTLDLFWGGSFDNTLSFSLLLLSLYIIKQHHPQENHLENEQ